MSSAHHSSGAGTSPDEAEHLADGYTGAARAQPAPALRRQESRASQRSIPIGSLDPAGESRRARLWRRRGDAAVSVELLRFVREQQHYRAD
jgi:hypothetical protein